MLLQKTADRIHLPKDGYRWNTTFGGAKPEISARKAEDLSTLA